MKFELKKLMLEGCFGSIRLGDTPQKVVRLLGFPKEYHVRDRSMTRGDILKNSAALEVLSLKYGSIEFWFTFGELYLLYSDHFEKDLIFRSECYFDSWVFQSGLCIKDFLRILKLENLKYSIFQEIVVTDGIAWRIYFSHNTFVTFSSEPHITGIHDGETWVNQVKELSCPEIVNFNLFTEQRMPEELPYLKQIHNIEELLL
jgi:hypothetical protein